MPKRLSRALEALRQRRSVPLLGRFSSYIQGLPASDKLIAALLGSIVIVASLLSLLALERSILVRVPAYGGSLAEGVVGSPRFVNPLLASSDTDRDLSALTYAGLMGIGENGTLVPVLAESYTAAPDGKSYTFVLRAGAVFSDGTPVTADDVVFTVEKAQDPALKSPELANWANIRAEAVDARTIRFTLPKAYAPFLEDTTLGILPARLWRNIPDGEFPFSPYMSSPVGAGPFTAADITRDKNGVITQYSLRAFKDYALGRPYLDSIRFRFFDTQSDLATAWKHHQVDSGYGIAAPGALRASYSRIFGGFFNKESNPALGKLEVRKALSLAIDRDHLVTDVLGGYAAPLLGPVPPGSGVNEPPVVPMDTATRILTAKKILTDAGWKYDAETKSWKLASAKKGGTTLTLDSLTLKTSNVPELKAIASSVQGDWQALGIPVSIELYEPGDLTASVIRPRNYEVLLFGMVVGRDRDLFAFWSSTERTDPGLNIADYSNHAVDLLLASARTESNPTAATADLQKISDLIAADYPAAFTHAPDFLYAVPKNLQGVSLPQIASPSDRFATVNTWYRQSEYVWPFLVHSR